MLLKVAAACHDCGFLVVCKNHEEAGRGIAFEALPKFGFSKEQMDTVLICLKQQKFRSPPRTS